MAPKDQQKNISNNRSATFKSIKFYETDPR